MVIQNIRKDTLVIHLSAELRDRATSLPYLVRLSGGTVELELDRGICFCCGWGAKWDQAPLTHHPPITLAMQMPPTRRNRKLWWCHSLLGAPPPHVWMWITERARRLRYGMSVPFRSAQSHWKVCDGSQEVSRRCVGAENAARGCEYTYVTQWLNQPLLVLERCLLWAWCLPVRI